ncbi:MAG: type VI secretion system protein TssA [Candidatus Adiutrix sp.]|jgi:type VI secretion system protein VasJ|nr:type VI secretion system protein TssA [Candidatus Adiutrix sp.]
MAADPGKDPISPEAPAGTDIRYGADFPALQAEIDKLSSLSGAAGGVDWKLAAELGERILTGQSKDLLVAAYLAAAWLATEGPAGLARGLSLLSGLLENFWDSLFPPLKRLRARINALTWWQEKTAARLEKYDGPELDRELYLTLNDGLEHLDRLVGEKMPGAGSLADLKNLVRRLPSVQEASTGPEASAVEPSAPPPPPPAAPRAGEKPADPASARRLLAEAAGNFARLGAEDGFQDPWRWKASRWSVWLPIVSAPPSENGRTLLPPPPSEVRDRILAHLENGRLREAAQAAEEQTGAYIFWLDLHCWCARALGGLGPAFEAAASAVRLETLNFTDRWPGLVDLAFNDGTALADGDTRRWLAGSRSDSGAVAESDGLGELDRLIAAGETASALTFLSRTLASAPEGMKKYQLLIRQTELMFRLGRKRTAAGLADLLIGEIDRRDLAGWDPPLARAALLAAHRAYSRCGPEKTDRARLTAARLAALFPEDVPSLPPEED